MSISIYPYLFGLGFGFSLIVGIGPQNAFVIKQGLLKSNILTAVLSCSACDVALIILGVCGIGQSLNSYPHLVKHLTIAAVLLLFCYAIRSFYQALKGDNSLIVNEQTTESVFKTFVLAMSFSLLNPHVYLDTIILGGLLSRQFNGSARLLYTLGFISASILWFFTIGFGARSVAKYLESKRSIQYLNFFIGIIVLLGMLGLIKSSFYPKIL